MISFKHAEYGRLVEESAKLHKAHYRFLEPLVINDHMRFDTLPSI
jgi:hypothetical protein